LDYRPNHEFGIIENLEKDKKYNSYDPEKYKCISVDDELILRLMESLTTIKTYYHSMNRPEFGLAYHGITLIPPESLPQFRENILSCEKKHRSEQLLALLNVITHAIERRKYLIHFGI